MVRRTLALTLVVAITSVLCITTILPSSAVNALSGSQFNAARIIDDLVFYDGSSMTTSEVQAFLNAKVPDCDTYGEKRYTGSRPAKDYNGDGIIQRWERGKYAGNPKPFICLKNYKQDTPERTAESGICGYLPARSNRSAAAIITDVANACSVSPKALIVLLQKEQALVTDDWPWTVQYQKATGYGCPDTAPCNTAYYGFFNQVYKAAWQFQKYRANPNNYNYVAGQNNKIYYNPNSSCGYSWVNIQNNATAGLYNYTPYRPNKAALDNLYGTGNSCSAYGNRNFWRYFNDWFGSTYAPSYAASYVTQSPYPTIAPGQSETVSITFKNNGSTPWYDTVTISNGTAPFGSRPTKLATTGPINRASDFADNSWGSDKNRPTATFDTVYDVTGTEYGTNPHIVKPGESAKFSFTVAAPESYSAGIYREKFVLVVEGGAGVIPTSPTEPWIDVTVSSVHSADFVSQSSYPSLVGGERSSAYFVFKNTGNIPWYDSTALASGKAPAGSHPTKLATTNPINRASSFSGDNWGTNDNRPTEKFAVVYDRNGNAYSTNPHVVKPGESARFNFTFTVPDNYTPGTYREKFVPVVEGGAGVIPTSPTEPWLDVTIQDAPSARPISNSVSTTVDPISTKTLTYTYKNTGSTTWTSAGTALHVVSGDASGLRDTSWTSDTKLAMLNESTVSPGNNGSFTVIYKTPIDSAHYTFAVSPKISSTNIGTSNLSNTITVREAIYKATYKSQSPYPTMKQNSLKSAYFTFRNDGNVPWYDSVSTTGAPDGVHPVHLATTNRINRWSKFVSSDWYSAPRPNKQFSAVYASDGTTLTSNQHVVYPGQIVRFNFTLYAPQLAPGEYREFFQPILEGGHPWDMGQIVWLDIRVQTSNYSAKYAGQSAYPTIARGNSKTAYFMFKNMGNVNWYDDISAATGDIKVVHLATTKPINRTSKFGSLFSGSSNRPALTLSAVYESNGSTLASNQHVVSPGQIGKYSFTLKAPDDVATGMYREYFQPIIEGGSPWTMDQVVWLDIEVIN